ncbi:phosphatidate cytidylyltransferase [Rhodoblastus acidophilus]|uniref:Phosphatidate cytidylyltransferase n=1 Tax=Rhodoblastus acidophilus TaxID=1074 RepID=A0A212REZ5_RHOAC|nr:CDP-archaeol synthase [Rhodoblastus acidophilus]MCW2316829.1 phosphatidate cytidylyltransferase [Rhodoblastus acidophilus]PPQ39689.1 CDP-archaeol synthase [Rhodoblastus acidophilus]RAI24471.1 CDP-archaeol synthase [Rhodoblastus acidophilus]SNB70935.1 phosphatidate cytidylyltransferase [Rhodoblastus acidophilus]
MTAPLSSRLAALKAGGGGFADLGLRAASALVLVVAAVAALYRGGLPFGLFWLVAALAAHWEWGNLIGGPLPWSRRIVGGAALALALALQSLGLSELALLALALAAAFNAWAAGVGYRFLAATGVFYCGGLLLAVTALRQPDFFGVCAIGWLFAVVWGTDVCAYFGGRFIGGKKLAPSISPGKTWSGFLVGVGCGAVLGAFVAAFWPDVRAPFFPVLLLGLAAGALAQVGDLFESWLKRRANVKDSSRLIPGHGGVMDRLDGFIFAAIFAALFGLSRVALQGWPSAAAGLFFWS